MATHTIIMNVPFTFDVEVEGEHTKEVVQDAILTQREESDWTETIKEHIDFYARTGKVEKFEVDEAVVIDL